jgi:hypothetical protein
MKNKPEDFGTLMETDFITSIIIQSNFLTLTLIRSLLNLELKEGRFL